MERDSIETIKPFVLSLVSFFKTMLNCEPALLKQKDAFNALEDRRVISVIGLSGKIRGTVALSMPIETALAMVERFIGMPCKELDETVIDAVSEMGNIFAGGAKTRLCPEGGVELSLPNVVICKGNMVFFSPSRASRATISFTSPLGPFDMMITLEVKKA